MATATQYRTDAQGNVYKTITGTSGKPIEVKLTQQAAQKVLANNQVPTPTTSPAPAPAVPSSTVPTPPSTSSNNTGYKTVLLNNGMQVGVNPQGEIWSWGGTLTPEAMQQYQSMGAQQGSDWLRSIAEQEYRAGNIANTWDFVPGQGTQWNTGTTNTSPFAVDLQTAARNAGQIPSPTTSTAPTATTGTNTPALPTMTVPTPPSASLEYERAQRERAMNEAINRLNTDYTRLMQNIQQDRTLENLQLGRLLNPFSGRSDYAMGMVTQERARTDRELQEDLQNRIAAIQAGYLDFMNNMPALEREYLREQEQRAFQNALQFANLFGYLPGNTPNPYSVMSGALPGFTAGGTSAAPLTLSAQNHLFNQAMTLADYARAAQQQQATLTGRVSNPEAEAMVNEILELKRQAETPGMPQDQVAQLSARANQLRQELAVRYGIDPGLIGADVPYSQAVRNAANLFQTLEARQWNQQFNAAEAQRAWENTFAERQFDFKVAQQLWENQFNERNFEESVRQQAQKMGLEWSKLNQQQQQFVAEMAYKEKALELEREQFLAAQNRAPQPTQNDMIAEYVANLDRLPQDQIERVLKEERANIIRDIGTSGYNFLVSTYIKSQSAQNELLKGLLNE